MDLLDSSVVVAWRVGAALERAAGRGRGALTGTGLAL